jgi:hypothetical protein
MTRNVTTMTSLLCTSWIDKANNRPVKKSISSDQLRASYPRLSHDRTTSTELPKRPGPGARRHTTSVASMSDLVLEGVHMPVYTLTGFPTLDLHHPPEVKSAWDTFCHHQDILISCVRTMQFDRYQMNVSLDVGSLMLVRTILDLFTTAGHHAIPDGTSGKPYRVCFRV